MELLSSDSDPLATQPLPASEALLIEQFTFWFNFEQISGFFLHEEKVVCTLQQQAQEHAVLDGE